MKIYTEIIYEWTDDGLKEVSSESFDYEGEVSLCKGVSISLPTINPKPPSINITPDLSALSDPLGDLGQGINTGLASGTDALGSALQMGGSAQEALQAGGKGLTQGLNQSVGQIGTGILQPLVTEVGAGIDAGLGFAAMLGSKLSEFIHGPGPGPSSPKIKKESMKAGLKGKKASELGANKGKARARKSLRIGK